MVKHVWSGLICCGVANWLIYDYVESSVKLLYMLVVMFVSCLLLIWHHRITRKWGMNRVDEDNRDYDVDHFPIFINSTCVAFVLLLVACIFWPTGVVIGVVTALISFIVASIREARYT